MLAGDPGWLGFDERLRPTLLSSPFVGTPPKIENVVLLTEKRFTDLVAQLYSFDSVLYQGSGRIITASSRADALTYMGMIEQPPDRSAMLDQLSDRERDLHERIQSKSPFDREWQFAATFAVRTILCSRYPHFMSGGYGQSGDRDNMYASFRLSRADWEGFPSQDAVLDELATIARDAYRLGTLTDRMKPVLRVNVIDVGVQPHGSPKEMFSNVETRDMPTTVVGAVVVGDPRRPGNVLASRDILTA